MNPDVKGCINTAFVGNDGTNFVENGLELHVKDRKDYDNGCQIGQTSTCEKCPNPTVRVQELSTNPAIILEVDVEPAPLLYRISDTPPVSLLVFFALQQCLLSIAGSLIAPQLVAKAVCAGDDNSLVRKLVSSTLVMNGVTTFLQNVIGIRLPVFQGPSSSYIVPIIALNDIDINRCNASFVFPESINQNISAAELQSDLVDLRLREMVGPLVLVGSLHCLIGATGLVGVLMRFIGPITIVPTILLIGIYIVKPAMDYTEVNWGVAAITWIVGLILSMYLGHRPMPIPLWSRKKGFHVVRYPLHQVFAVLLSLMFGWAISAVFTYAGAFTNDKNDIGYKARTDAKSSGITDSEWFYFPYPGQFGSPMFSASVLIGFLIATLTSILDSIGDYYATAAMCRVPKPPSHSINRGIAIEGFCTMVSGFMGMGHATTTYGGNIGAIGMTKVASRRVFILMAIIYVLFGIFSKVSAIFVSIPDPVLGGSLITIIGVFVGINLSNLQVIDLASTRNLSIIGMGVFVGLLVPTWINKNAHSIDTGNPQADQVLTMLLGNPNFFGGALACFLDNTVPGTDEERGIAAWKNPQLETETSKSQYLEGSEVYDVPLPECVKRQTWLLKRIPFLINNDNKQLRKD